MPAQGKHKAVKGTPKGGKALRTEKVTTKDVKTQAVKAVPAVESADLAAEVKRLAREVEAIKAVLSQRLGGGHDGGAARRDQDKLVADRLARLDEKVEAVWNRVADLEERLEGESASGHETDDFDDAPEKDFYER